MIKNKITSIFVYEYFMTFLHVSTIIVFVIFAYIKEYKEKKYEIIRDGSFTIYIDTTNY